MEQLLFINACVRGERSRTLKLARRFLESWQKAHPDGAVTEVDLCKDRPVPKYPEVLAERDARCEAGKLDHPMFNLAHQFANADRIVMAAPFWELSLPAILKIYLERITVTNITFGYNEQGANVGLCKAGKLLLITTRGGNFSRPETAWMEMGARQLEALCAMYGIPSFQCLAAEGLDDIRNDKEAILAEAMSRADALAEVF